VDAAKGKQFQWINDLINKGADVKAKDKHGDTALIWAAYWGSFDTVKLLLEHKADIQSISKCGWTAGSLASTKGHTAVAEILLSTEPSNTRGVHCKSKEPTIKVPPDAMIEMISSSVATSTNHVNTDAEEDMTAINTTRGVAVMREDRDLAQCPEKQQKEAKNIREKTLLTEETRVDHQQRQSEEGKNENSLLERQFMDSERRIELLQRQLMDSREHIHLLAGENSSLRARLMAVQKEKHDLEERIESLQAHVVSFNRSMERDPGSPLSAELHHRGSPFSLGHLFHDHLYHHQQQQKEEEEDHPVQRTFRSLDDIKTVPQHRRRPRLSLPVSSRPTSPLQHEDARGHDQTLESSLLDYLKSPESKTSTAASSAEAGGGGRDAEVAAAVRWPSSPPERSQLHSPDYFFDPSASSLSLISPASASSKSSNEKGVTAATMWPAYLISNPPATASNINEEAAAKEAGEEAGEDDGACRGGETHENRGLHENESDVKNTERKLSQLPLDSGATLAASSIPSPNVSSLEKGQAAAAAAAIQKAMLYRGRRSKSEGNRVPLPPPSLSSSLLPSTSLQYPPRQAKPPSQSTNAMTKTIPEQHNRNVNDREGCRRRRRRCMSASTYRTARPNSSTVQSSPQLIRKVMREDEEG